MQDQANRRSVEFTGKGGEYFQLVIVNVLLTALTLGIYSAWATVRTKQYLYGHTSVDGHRFQYHGNPVQILKGRLIAIGIFILYMIISAAAPIMAFILLLVFLGMIPWMIVQSKKFNHQMMSYRNVRFNFVGTKMDAFLVYILYPILSIFTLYTLVPWLLKEQTEYSVRNKMYGPKQFECHLSTGKFYGIFGYVLLTLLVGIPVLGAIFVGFMMASRNYDYGFMFLTQLLLVIVFLILITAIASIIQAMSWAHIATQTRIPNVAEFSSNMTAKGFLKLNLVSLIAVIFTLGFAGPWVIIRQIRYTCEHTQYEIKPCIEDIIAEKVEAAGPLGEEVAEVFDIDVGGSII